jgi:hypothetical protein
MRKLLMGRTKLKAVFFDMTFAHRSKKENVMQVRAIYEARYCLDVL